MLLCAVMLDPLIEMAIPEEEACSRGRKSVVWNNGGKHGMAENGGSTVRMVMAEEAQALSTYHPTFLPRGTTIPLQPRGTTSSSLPNSIYQGWVP
ncbi:hypothetical protein RHS01_10645 [Rhizoctonia solani]|uniref:Uncharacterized protein n=1 Tax=Rhizoctonia solani TaxID=456999 RepID=A0A8H7I4G6_9AGAM|nr:hypothetical protein RHS01_10645 [Rhizoctonia solani]